MFLCYLDESGNTGLRLDDPDQPTHFLAAVMVPEAKLGVLHGCHAAVLAEHWPDTTFEPREFHGADLFRGSGPWKGVPPPRRVAAFRAMLEVLTEAEASVAHAAIDKAKLAQRYTYPESPHILALTFLAQKIDAWVPGQLAPLDHQRAILVADATEEHEAQAIRMVRRMQETGDPFFRKQLKKIVESIFFVKSENSPGVQLADLIAFSLNRRAQVRESQPIQRGDRVLRELFDELVEPRVQTWRETWPSD